MKVPHIDSRAGVVIQQAFTRLLEALAFLLGLQLDSVADITALEGTDDTHCEDGVVKYVRSVGDWFILNKSSTMHIDDITVASTLSGTGRWIRTLMGNPQWLGQATWYVNSLTGNDEATGASSAAALRTTAEFARRVQNATITEVTTVWIEEDVAADDELNLDVELASGAALRIRGVPTLELTALVTGWSRDVAGGNNPGTIALAGWTVADHIARLITFTDGAAAAAWGWIVRDLGAGDARVSTILDGTFDGWPTGIKIPAIGNTAQVYSIPTLRVGTVTMRGPSLAAFTVDSVKVVTDDIYGVNSMNIQSGIMYHCFFDAHTILSNHHALYVMNCSGAPYYYGGEYAVLGGAWTSSDVLANVGFQYQPLWDSDYPASGAILPGLLIGPQQYIGTEDIISFFGDAPWGAVYVGLGGLFGARGVQGNVTGLGVYLSTCARMTLDNPSASSIVCSVNDIELEFNNPQYITFAQCPFSTWHTDIAVVSHDTHSVENQLGGVPSEVSVGVKGALTAGATAFALQDLTESATEVPKLAYQNATLGNLRAYSRVAPGAGESVTITVLLNGAPTTLTCQIANAAQTASDIDNTHRTVVAPGDRISVQTVNTNNGGFAASDLSVVCEMA